MIRATKKRSHPYIHLDSSSNRNTTRVQKVANSFPFKFGHEGRRMTHARNNYQLVLTGNALQTIMGQHLVCSLLRQQRRITAAHNQDARGRNVVKLSPELRILGHDRCEWLADAVVIRKGEHCVGRILRPRFGRQIGQSPGRVRAEFLPQLLGLCEEGVQTANTSGRSCE